MSKTTNPLAGYTTVGYVPRYPGHPKGYKGAMKGEFREKKRLHPGISLRVRADKGRDIKGGLDATRVEGWHIYGKHPKFKGSHDIYGTLIT